MSFLDFLFPKRCVQCRKMGAYLCPQCFAYISFIEHMMCAVCQRQTMDGRTHPRCMTRYGIDGVFSSIVYKGVVKKLIYTFKYPPYLTTLQPILIDLFYEGIIQKERLYSILTASPIFVPIPLYSGKYRRRGYNQAQLLAVGIAARFDGVVLDCLQRIKNTHTQVGLDKESRKKNIAGAFAVKTAFASVVRQSAQVILVDDVATSGATLREAASMLKRAGVKKVWAITLAHGE